jgi:hypothetical protein
MPISTSKQSQRTNNINQAQTASDQAVVIREVGNKKGNVRIGKKGVLNQITNTTYQGLTETDLAGILQRLNPGGDSAPENSARPLPFTDPAPGLDLISEAVAERVTDQVENAPDESRKRMTLAIIGGVVLFVTVLGVALVGFVLVKGKKKGSA